MGNSWTLIDEDPCAKKFDEVEIVAKKMAEVKISEEKTFALMMLLDLGIPKHYQLFVDEEALEWNVIKGFKDQHLKALGLKVGPRVLVSDYIEAKISAETAS